MDGPEEGRRPGGISPHAKAILMVAAVVALFVLLYITVAGLFGSPAGVAPFTVDVTRDATNWSVRFTGVPGNHLPADTFLVIRNASEAIVLRRTSFADLTVANWSANRALYVDMAPASAEVRSGDRLQIDVGSHPAGSAIEISDRTGLLLIKVLQ
jgi:hypothetical protein